MKNRAVRLGYLSKTQNNALNQKHPQNNQLEALNLWNKLPQMKKTYRMKLACKILTSDGSLFLSQYVCLGWFYCCLSTGSRDEKQVKMTSQELNFSTHTVQKHRVTMPVHEFKFNDEIIYNDLYVYHIFIIDLRSAQKSYSTRPNNKSKGNTTTNSKKKKRCTILNKKVCECSLDIIPMCICPCIAAVEMRTVNSCICLMPHILSCLTVKELSDTVLEYNKVSKELLGTVWFTVRKKSTVLVTGAVP